MCSPRDRTDSRVLPLHYLFLLQNSRARLHLRMEESKGRVCVTGGTGFIGSWIIKRDFLKMVTLLILPLDLTQIQSSIIFRCRAQERCELSHKFARSISEAANSECRPKRDRELQGTHCRVHGSVPCGYFIGFLTKRNLKRLSIDGALGILKACLSSKTVKRVVYTSSAAAVTHRDKEVEVVDESSWTDVDSFRTSKQFGWSYAISKTLTEKAVLEFGEQNGLHVVTLVPTFVVGPFICPKLAGSVGSTLFLTWSLRESTNLKVTDLSSKKFIDAGFEYKYGLEEMLVDAIECCKEKGYL